MALLSKRFALSLLAVRRSFERGEPVVTWKLFDPRNPSSADTFAEALAELERLECRCRAYEVTEGQTWNSSDTHYQLTVERLRNIIAAHRSSLKRQYWLSEREDPDPA